MPGFRMMHRSWMRVGLWVSGAVVVFLVLGTVGHLVNRSKSATRGLGEAIGSITPAATTATGMEYAHGAPQYEQVRDAATAATPGAVPGDSPSPFGDGALQLTALNDFGRSIIRTGDLQIEVSDIDNAYQQVVRIADSVGAMVTAANLSRRPKAPGEEGKPEPASAQFTLRVPGGQFFALLTALDQLGTVVTKQISSNDVTEQFVDLESRLRHWRAQEEQLLALMRRAGAIKDIMTVRNELAQVQLEIERLEGQIRFLNSRVDLSTVTINLVPTGTTKKAPEVLPFGAQIGGGWDKVRGAFLSSMHDLVAGLTWAALVTAYLIPFGILVLLGLSGYRLARPRWARKPAGA